MRKRILIFVHDGRGLGHLRRLSRIAERLQEQASVLFLTGHRDASWMVPKGSEFIHLPSLDSIDRRRSRHWGRAPFLGDDAMRGRALRKTLIASAIEAFDPDGFISDYLPLGMDDELLPFLRSSSRCRKYFIVRGILGDPKDVPVHVLTPNAREALSSYYDLILAACDQRIADIARDYNLEPELARKLRYTGYCMEALQREASSRARRDRRIPDGMPWVVCTAGGGKDGEDLLQACWQLALQYPEYCFDLIVGPRSRLSALEEGFHAGTRILVRQADTAMPSRLGGADIVVCRGGYNSLMEASAGQARIIVAPIIDDYEQVHHARRLAAFRPMFVIDRLEDLDLALEDALEQPRPQGGLGDLRCNGLALCSHYILTDLTGQEEERDNEDVTPYAITEVSHG